MGNMDSIRLLFFNSNGLSGVIAADRDLLSGYPEMSFFSNTTFILFDSIGPQLFV
jgi:hypothetical protein